MPNVRVNKTDFNQTTRSIVAIPDHYVALAAQIPASAATVVGGKKYILAGTCVKNATSLEGRKTGLQVVAQGEQFDGVIFADQRVYEGEENVTVTVLVHGFVKYAALQKVENTVPESKNAMILVVK
jgi:hypothetical protein